MAVAVTGNTSPVITVRAIVGDGDAGTQDWTATRPLRVFDAVCFTTAAGNAGNTVDIWNGALGVIETGMVTNADLGVSRPTTHDDANELIAVGGFLRLAIAKVLGALSCEVYVHCVGA